MFVCFSLTEYDPEQRHIVRRTIRGLAVELDQVLDFHDWAATTWPGDQWRADLVPGQAPPALRRSD